MKGNPNKGERYLGLAMMVVGLMHISFGIFLILGGGNG